MTEGAVVISFKALKPRVVVVVKLLQNTLSFSNPRIYLSACGWVLSHACKHAVLASYGVPHVCEGVGNAGRSGFQGPYCQPPSWT